MFNKNDNRNDNRQENRNNRQRSYSSNSNYNGNSNYKSNYNNKNTNYSNNNFKNEKFNNKKSTFNEKSNREINVEFELKDGKLPKYMTDDSTGADIFYTGNTKLIFEEKTIIKIPTGLILKKIPNRLEIQIRSRSSLASLGLILLGPTSVSISDINEEIILTFIKITEGKLEINTHDRIGQFVFVFIQKVDFLLSNHLSSTERGENGFGSTNFNSKN